MIVAFPQSSDLAAQQDKRTLIRLIAKIIPGNEYPERESLTILIQVGLAKAQAEHLSSDNPNQHSALRHPLVQVFSVTLRLRAQAASVVAQAHLVVQLPTIVLLEAVLLGAASHSVNPSRPLGPGLGLDCLVPLEVLLAPQLLVPTSPIHSVSRE